MPSRCFKYIFMYRLMDEIVLMLMLLRIKNCLADLRRAAARRHRSRCRRCRYQGQCWKWRQARETEETKCKKFTTTAVVECLGSCHKKQQQQQLQPQQLQQLKQQQSQQLQQQQSRGRSLKPSLNELFELFELLGLKQV